ncbi:major histocompatibility complex class I-related gene protein-like isoform X5 [Acanthopagrus latus]|uniref:major histocompatibility complex class I-related gene protein-like isoform X2 n=1 Tax=Acanthopagrus latus TaxID=8177 RepID=UPI00187C0D26|nr:major histocompatibility complex class I-related gene protein-like isoform X2 [Acanthopagrus latus]XP_036945808.1 major histocompatibility complex class I-related gene protein-like isoform X5 [Acanthopagrus latus]
MRTLLLLLLFCHVSSAVLHSMKHFITASTGIPNIPEVVTTVEIDEHLVGTCDSKENMDVKDIAKSFIIKYPEQLEWLKQECLSVLPIFKPRTHSLMRLYNQTGGVHVLQKVEGCEWDDETDEVKGFSQYGYDGEDLLKLDPKTFTWIALRPEAVNISMMWYTNTYLRGSFKTVLTHFFPELLRQFVEYGRSVLLRTELPSVSLLQKTPSSPVSCLATGFYPHRASLVWRKDGEELHEEVDHGEILPNHDGTFQMRVHLNLSSVTPEAWTRYDCVFQLSSVKEEIITKLEKDRIRTNWVKPSNMTVPVTAAVVVLALILIGAAGFIVYKKKKAISPPSAPDNSAELSEPLNPET